MTFKSSFPGVLWALVICLFTSAAALAKSESAANSGYTAVDQEYYMADQLYFFFRPGVAFELISIEIPEDRQPLVTFSLTDPMGMPLDRDGIYTPGPINQTMMLSYIPQGETQKINYGFYDNGGVYTAMGDGVYTYKFALVLPEDYDADATHTFAVVTRRDLQEFDLDLYHDVDVHNFVPSGAEMVTPPRDIVSSETCKRCHDPLEMHTSHGGYWDEVQMCQHCHNPSMVFGGESIRFDKLIHHVHMEAAEFPAPINDCETCHTGGTPTADIPLVANPSPTPSCDASGLGMTELSWGDAGPVEIHVNAADGPLFAASSGANSKATGKWVDDAMAFFLVDSGSGEVLQELPVNTTVLGCAGNAPGTFRGEAAALHANWKTMPTRAACGGCHSDIDFETGEGHIPMPNDEFCGLCHRPIGDEYDRSVPGAHTVDYKSNQLGGILVDILHVQDTDPGDRPLVTFSLSNKWGPLPPDMLGRLRFSLSGPNDDFEFYAQDDALGRVVASGTNWTFRFDSKLPDDAIGSFSIGVEGRMSAVLNEGEDNEFTMNDQMQNFIVPFAVTDADTMARRVVVDDAKCESCHTNLSLHGSNRHNATEYCQTCHMPSATDEEVRLEGLPVTIDFRTMIHKIHRGADLEKGYLVYGYRSSIHDYSDLHYVGDLRNCEACHVDDSYTLPLPAGVLPVENPQAPWTPMLPEAATCLSCHDGDSAASHAASNTSDFGEACSTCHGVGKTYSVKRVHAR